jgi:hypothetical protein
MEAGGPEQNARLTAITGAVLLVLLAIEGLTLLSLQSLIPWHIFVGVLVIPSDTSWLHWLRVER